MHFDEMNKSPRLTAGVAIMCAYIAASQSCGAQSLPLDQIKVPQGFSIELAARVPSARAMAWGDRGTLFVGSSMGNIYALTFAAPNAGGEATVHSIASGLNDPGGVAFRDG